MPTRWGAAIFAVGYSALFGNTTGELNTASGDGALDSNTTGSSNTAMGFNAMAINDTGCENTAAGAYALFKNENSCFNSAFGYNALYANIGAYNTAVGYGAMQSNTTGLYNTASGADALFNSTTGSYNVALGLLAMSSATTGSNNVVIGADAGGNITSASNNIYVGYAAGTNVTGSNNIEIGNDGVLGDSGVIRIGTPGTHKEVFIASIHASKVTGSAVFVTTSGRLGVLASSERYKTAIATMGSTSARLAKLRPVTFKLKSDADGNLQYGLIAEEVAKVYPELVTRDESGRVDGVRYDELAPMLLNEMQHQRAVTAQAMDAQSAEIRDLKQQLAALNEATREMRAALVAIKSQDHLVARR